MAKGVYNSRNSAQRSARLDDDDSGSGAAGHLILAFLAIFVIGISLFGAIYFFLTDDKSRHHRNCCLLLGDPGGEKGHGKSGNTSKKSKHTVKGGGGVGKSSKSIKTRTIANNPPKRSNGKGSSRSGKLSSKKMLNKSFKSTKAKSTVKSAVKSKGK